MSDLIVNVAVSEHGVEVLHGLGHHKEEAGKQFLPQCQRVHGDFDNLVIVLQEEIRTRGSDWYLITSFQFINYLKKKSHRRKKMDVALKIIQKKYTVQG